MQSIEERVAALEAKMDLMLKELDDIKRELRKRNGYIKYMIYMYISTLSFLAALLGIHWPKG